MRFIDMNTSRNVDTKLYMIALISLFVSNHITISQQGQKREGDGEGGGETPKITGSLLSHFSKPV